MAFLPSLLDNCPFAIIECIQHGIPFLAAATGGIPEIVHPDQLFSPTVTGLTKALVTLPEKDWNVEHPYNAIKNNQAWHALHRSQPQEPWVSVNLPTKPPLVSVCIPYHEMPDYLPYALDSIRQQSYPNIEVIVCDDGSHTTQAKIVFESEKATAPSSNWHFFRQENRGVGPARNAAAALAKGDYLVFFDADNYARPEMIERMSAAIETSQADALTCYFTAFSKIKVPRADTQPDYLYRPLGAVLPLGLIDNTFGDANSIVRPDAFFAIDGFKDRDFFLRLYLSGREVDVIPEELFWYRYRPDSMLRQANEYKENRFILEAAFRDYPEFVTELAVECTLPFYKQLKKGSLSQKTSAPWHKHIYRWYRRMRRDPRYLKKSG